MRGVNHTPQQNTLHVISSNMTSHQPLPPLPMEAAHSNVHTQRLGLAEWPKWQQSSWPRWLRPAEWSSLCPHGHRGLAEMACFLRGHLAGLCSYPSNAGTGISTWITGGLAVDSRQIACEVMTCCMHAVIKGLVGLGTHEPTIVQSFKYLAIMTG